jgi:hypothetical protein
METYITKKDGNPLEVNVECSSDAAVDGIIVIFIYKQNDPSKNKSIDVVPLGDNKFKSLISKTDLEEKNILRIVSNFIVTEVQLPQKNNIVEKTTITYPLDGGSAEKEFKSTFEDNKEEYNKGGANKKTFKVKKEIQIAFIPKLKKDIEAMLLAQLNQ